MPGVSVELQAIDICNPDPIETAMGFGASVTVPSSVRLDNVYADAAGTIPLVTALVGDNGVERTFSIEFPNPPGTDFGPGECYTIYVGTTLSLIHI